MKLLIEIPDYMLQQLLALDMGIPMSLDSTIHACIAKEFNRQQEEKGNIISSIEDSK